MWQNLDISEMAKARSPVFHTSKTRQVEIFQHLRDFSIRQLSDETIEILTPQEKKQKEETEEEAHDISTIREDSAQQMSPFSLDEAENKKSDSKPEIDIEAIKNEAFEQGRLAAKADYEEIRARLVEAHRLALAEARQTVINSVAGDLVAACTTGFAKFHASLQEALARLVRPLIAEKLTVDGVAQFVQKLACEAIEASDPLIIEGEQALLDAFIIQAKAEPTINLSHYKLQAREGQELRLIVGDQILSTRLAPLLRQLREII